MTSENFSAWAIKHVNDSLLDGRREWFEGGARFDRPAQFGGCIIMLFSTKKAAGQFIRKEHGYLARMPDLRKPPHCWRMPKAVRVKLTIAENMRK